MTGTASPISTKDSFGGLLTGEIGGGAAHVVGWGVVAVSPQRSVFPPEAASH